MYFQAVNSFLHPLCMTNGEVDGKIASPIHFANHKKTLREGESLIKIKIHSKSSLQSSRGCSCPKQIFTKS